MNEALHLGNHDRQVRQSYTPGITVKEIAERLAYQVEPVAAFLLPNGKRIGQQWVVGSVHGEPGKSLKVQLTGEKQGRWVDKADELQHGDLLDLWAATQGLEVSEAIQEAKAYLGLDEVSKGSRPYIKPPPQPKSVDTEVEAVQTRQQARSRAKAFWEKGKPATTHLYTDQKGLKPEGLRMLGDELLIPMYDAEEQLSSVQRIRPNGAKLFLKNCTVSGCYFMIGKPVENFLVLCEGWATGMSIHDATGLTVVVAFSSGNLGRVARLMSEKYPNCVIVLAPDNDKEQHAVRMAEEAARKHDCQVVVPQFPEGTEGTDFDDLRQAAGRDEVMRQIMKCRYRPVSGSFAQSEPVVKYPEFPLEALGPVLSEAAQAIARSVQAPGHLAGQSVLAATALAVQAHANVGIDNREHPLSLFCLTIGESGERKSGCDKFALHAHREWERDKQKEAREEVAAYQNELDAWKLDRKKALVKNDLDGFKPEPAPPIQGFFICEEPTLEGLQRSFRFGLASQGLFSDEGGQFFGGHAMNPDNALKTMAGLSKFWDGATQKRTRAANDESWSGCDRRLSCHLMAQPVVAGTVLSDPLMQQQGILARFLISSGQHLFGLRAYCKPRTEDLAAISRYHAAITTLLNRSWCLDDDGGLKLATIRPSPEAMAIWVTAYDSIEEELLDGGEYANMRAFASKAAEHIARIAGVMAAFSGYTSIDADTMNNAIILAVCRV